MGEAAHSLIVGVSRHFEKKDEPIPERVAQAVDDMKKRVGDIKNWEAKCSQYEIKLVQLGDRMGEACWQDGEEHGVRFADPSKGETRIDLTPQDISNLHWLAHYGFEHMIWKTSSHAFKDEADARRATRAIEKLHRHLPKDQIDESDPYALAINRDMMIWETWPTEPEKS